MLRWLLTATLARDDEVRFFIGGQKSMRASTVKERITMGTKFMVSVPDAMTSKAEEVGVLAKLADRMPDNTYLGMFFTNKLLFWFTDQVRQDWSTDIFASYEHAKEEHQKVCDLNVELNEDLKRQERMLTKDVEDWKRIAQQNANDRDDNYRKMVDFESRLREEVARHNETKRKMNTKVSRLKAAIGRFRKIAAKREENWQFFSKQIQS
jgi:hypothetical protein